MTYIQINNNHRKLTPAARDVMGWPPYAKVYLPELQSSVGMASARKAA